ncbi:hypothetical protein [Aureivirga sp. CE67]|uniref:hypothetical protein n=1 Tax=Aureivirga sp. CE67 TaxID=1788983 RepID=UPI0018CAE9A5|nr:hypothetical protein [Aureivirga sp. CE67]
MFKIDRAACTLFMIYGILFFLFYLFNKFGDFIIDDGITGELLYLDKRNQNIDYLIFLLNLFWLITSSSLIIPILRRSTIFRVFVIIAGLISINEEYLNTFKNAVVTMSTEVHSTTSLDLIKFVLFSLLILFTLFLQFLFRKGKEIFIKQKIN